MTHLKQKRSELEAKNIPDLISHRGDTGSRDLSIGFAFLGAEPLI